MPIPAAVESRWRTALHAPHLSRSVTNGILVSGFTESGSTHCFCFELLTPRAKMLNAAIVCIGSLVPKVL